MLRSRHLLTGDKDRGEAVESVTPPCILEEEVAGECLRWLRPAFGSGEGWNQYVSNYRAY